MDSVQVTQAFLAGFESANSVAWILFLAILPAVLLRLSDWIK